MGPQYLHFGFFLAFAVGLTDVASLGQTDTPVNLVLGLPSGGRTQQGGGECPSEYGELKGNAYELSQDNSGEGLLIRSACAVRLSVA
jgi:hypothetical protein